MNKKLLLLFIFSTSIRAELTINDQIHQQQVNSQYFRRKQVAFATRTATDNVQAEVPIPNHPNNGDIYLYDDHRGDFAKALLQNVTGLVNNEAFQSLLTAIFTGTPNDFNKIIMGSSGPRRLVNPQASYAFTLEGADAWINTMPSAPAFASAETAAEMVELYWTVTLRDTPFNQYDDALAQMAIDDLNSLQDFKGPKINGQVTPQTLLRDNLPGCLIGPYISQFLYQPIPLGPGPNGGVNLVEQEYYVPIQGNVINMNSFMANFNDWFFIQNGGTSPYTTTYEADKTFFRTARDIGEFVHVDFPEQVYLNAALILYSYGPQALDSNNPYRSNATQEGFVTYGIEDILAMLGFVARLALETAWFQKWKVHLRCRPEFYGFAVNQQILGIIDFGIHPQLIDSPVIPLIFNAFGTYFLPQMYPEGSPAHPSYPAGHAVVAGAMVTLLKAFFNENFIIPNPVQPNDDNTDLEDYTGEPLTVGNELNKLGTNIYLARDHAGVHYRSDGYYGALLGEKVAIAFLQDEGYTKNEPFNGFSLTTFSGQKIKVGERQVAL